MNWGADLEMQPEEAALRLTQQPRPRLIDCRELDEWHLCRIEGAELVPLSIFAEQAPRRLLETEGDILVYCHHGMRSLHAVQWLRRQGYAGARSLAGGIEAWSLRVDATVPRY